MNKGLAIVFSGPSGVGKDTIREEVFKDKSLNLFYSVSMTTRSPREGEAEGVDYYYVSKETFENAIKNNELIEYAEFVGNYYGTPFKKVEEQREKGENVMLEIETNGALQILKKLKDDKGLISFFIVPPNFKELRKRIVNRKTEDEATIKLRLKKAKKEMKLKKFYDHVIVNDNLNVAVEEVKKYIREKLDSLK